MSPVDMTTVRRVHREVGERLHETQQTRERTGQGRLDRAGQQQFSRMLIAEVLRETAVNALESGAAPLNVDEEAALAEAVYSRMFGAGRLQRLLDDTEIENIDINGADEVWVTRAGGAVAARVEAVAGDDDELIELVQTLASYAGLNSRPWDAANPELDLKLPDGSRLSAIMGVAARPSISIRRHRFEKVELSDLVGNGTLSDEAAHFLRALVRARCNVMIAGSTAAGKTTLLRALAAEIGPDERIITVEKSLELGLRSDSERHPNCIELEERIANSEGHGAVPMRSLVRRTLRQNPHRVIVGEVLGDEVIDMLNAMGQGNDGSMSTIHARSAKDVFQRIASYAVQGNERIPHEASFQLIAGGLDFVVFVSRHPVTGERRVESVIEVNGFDEGRVLSSEIFAAPVRGAAAIWTGVVPGRTEELEAAGWAPGWDR